MKRIALQNKEWNKISEKVLDFLESNKNEYLIIENDTNNSKWMLEYDGLTQDTLVPYYKINYKKMIPLHKYQEEGNIYYNDKFTIFYRNSGDYIRKATEEEIELFGSIITEKENKLESIKKKYNANNINELKLSIIEDIINSDDIIKTLTNILNK